VSPEQVWGMRAVAKLLKWCRLSHGLEIAANGSINGNGNGSTNGFSVWLSEHGHRYSPSNINKYERAGTIDKHSSSLLKVRKEYLAAICATHQLAWSYEELLLLSEGVLPPCVETPELSADGRLDVVVAERVKNAAKTLTSAERDVLSSAVSEGVLMLDVEGVIAQALGVGVEDVKAWALAQIIADVKQEPLPELSPSRARALPSRSKGLIEICEAMEPHDALLEIIKALQHVAGRIHEGVEELSNESIALTIPLESTQKLNRLLDAESAYQGLGDDAELAEYLKIPIETLSSMRNGVLPDKEELGLDEIALCFSRRLYDHEADRKLPTDFFLSLLKIASPV
jgi:hypothetical protein